MKKIICACTLDKQCKSCYDKYRYKNIKEGTWDFNNKCPEILSIDQEQILIGGLLGDLYLYQYKKQINAGVGINRAIKDYDYLTFQFESFKKFCQIGIQERTQFDKRTGKTYIGCGFRTQTSKIFTPYRLSWYPNGEKKVPRNLDLTPLICAIWFADDGSVIRCGSNKNRIKISIYTDGFVKDDVEFLSSKLNAQLGTSLKLTHKNSTKNKDKGYYIYSSNDDDTYAFIRYIDPVFPASMNRKSNLWKGFI